jgi:hypothetical protein
MFIIVRRIIMNGYERMGMNVVTKREIRAPTG